MSKIKNITKLMLNSFLINDWFFNLTSEQQNKMLGLLKRVVKNDYNLDIEIKGVISQTFFISSICFTIKLNNDEQLEIYVSDEIDNYKDKLDCICLKRVKDNEFNVAEIGESVLKEL